MIRFLQANRIGLMSEHIRDYFRACKPVRAIQFKWWGIHGEDLNYEIFVDLPIQRDDKGPHVIVETYNGNARCEAGDWLVIHECGRREVVAPDEFWLNYDVRKSECPDDVRKSERGMWGEKKG